ncbi:MAG TPA: hypothetical protein ENF37_02585 [Beggiatoa sp.]|nr:hypothetical protein [Beggiatoa sp.]
MIGGQQKDVTHPTLIGGQQKYKTHPTLIGGQQKDVTHPTLIWWATKRRYPPYNSLNLITDN